MRPTKEQRAQLKRENKLWPEELKRMEPHPPNAPKGCIEVWRSRRFLVQVYRDRPGILRLTVCRTVHNGNRWHDGITWDELQQIKRECGHAEKDAVEVYPRDRDIVNVANMRHLFVFEEALVEFAWRMK